MGGELLGPGIKQKVTWETRKGARVERRAHNSSKNKL
jgi:hypothetical protein